MTVQSLRDQDPAQRNLDHEVARIDLAAAFRWAARYGYHESIVNHFSLAVSEDGRQFLVNPFGRHWSRLRASDLVLADADDPGDLVSSYTVDPTAFNIHGPIHQALPQARCVLHTHMKHATVLACLKDSNLLPIEQNTMRFFGKVAVDGGFEGMAMENDEGARLAAVLGDKRVLVMGNHGVVVVGSSVARAFDDLYYFEKACETLVTAFMTGKELRVCSDEVARQTAADWETYPDMPERHFRELKAMLDESEPDYRT